ncbi:hypothetical protein HA402_000023 [Bradysia odoriphaga]|nr:hypothetical protein HA402_000023 [Bradysia odoriphaga]
MAKNTSTVYLGFEDEAITEKNKSLVDFMTNKVGGQPVWPSNDLSIAIPPCPICGLKRPLIFQIYAPLEHSPFHRTLYIFSCSQANCSNQSKSWLCLRVQQLEKVSDKDTANIRQTIVPNINWCSDANDWGEPDDMYNSDADNCNEQNGNIIKNDNRLSDEDDESNSMESDPIPAFGNLQVDDKNANCGAQGGAIGRIHSPNASAEIEGEESELVSIDTPLAPQRDLIALLKQTTAVPIDQSKIALRSFFVAVDEERFQSSNSHADHVRELMDRYQGQDEKLKTSPSSPVNVASGGGDESEEKYEKGIPKHGDLMFHNFLVTIQENAGQIIRYSRDSLPLLIAPLSDINLPTKCQNCGHELICEMQLLPSIIPKLQFINGDPAPIEFGNVLIFTCVQSCWDTPDKMRVEHVVVQVEG